MSETQATQVVVPAHIRLPLLHAYMQAVADGAGVEVLHVKGAAVHPEIQRSPRGSLDVDVLVRPSHVDRFLQELRTRGWVKVTGFDEGSAFHHAMNLRHALGLVDVHRQWPGFEIDPEVAFDLLWRQHSETEIAHIPCAVPSLTHQRLILLLHYGRSGGQRPDDLAASWTDADPEVKRQIRSAAETFRASLALAVATGDVGDHRNDPSYRLWRYFADGSGSRVEEWWGRWSAARGPMAKLAVARSFVRVNPDLLREELGREPTKDDYRRAFRDRVRTAFDDVVTVTRRRLGRGRS